MHDCGGGGWNNIYECIRMQVAIRLLDKRAAWFCILYEIVGKYQACMTAAAEDGIIYMNVLECK